MSTNKVNEVRWRKRRPEQGSNQSRYCDRRGEESNMQFQLDQLTQITDGVYITPKGATRTSNCLYDTAITNYLGRVAERRYRRDLRVRSIFSGKKQKI